MYLILIFIILLLIKCSCVENYYTFFIPYKKTIKFIDTNNIQKDITFITIRENELLLTNIIKYIISNTSLLNLKLKITNSNEESIKMLNNNKCQFLLLPKPSIYLINNYNNIRSLINLNKTSLFMIYNSNYFGKSNLSVSDFNQINKYNKLKIGILDGLTKEITKNFLKYQNNYIKNYELIEFKSFSSLIYNLTNKTDLNIGLFIDNNPSDKLNKVINQHFKEEIYIQELTLELFDINSQSYFIFEEEYISHINPSFLYPNNKYKTLSFSNLLLTNNLVSDKIVELVVNSIIMNKSFINKYLKNVNINTYNSMLPIFSIIPHKYTDNIFKTYNNRNRY